MRARIGFIYDELLRITKLMIEGIERDLGKRRILLGEFDQRDSDAPHVYLLVIGARARLVGDDLGRHPVRSTDQRLALLVRTLQDEQI